jgi:hypothetical protein
LASFVLAGISRQPGNRGRSRPRPGKGGQPVVIFTQTANARSMRLAAKLGFTEVERFEAWGAEQWFGMRSPVTPFD